MRVDPRRRDYVVGALHLIWRHYAGEPQYGAILWGRPSRTIDLFCGKTLLTLRRRSW